MARIRIYVAASSSAFEADRVTAAFDMIRNEPGMELAMDWVREIQVQGGANLCKPEAMRLHTVTEIMKAVRGADVLWLLLPPEDAPTAGAWAELGAAIAFSSVGAGPPKKLISSGTDVDRYRSIFTAACREHFASDVQAFSAIRMYAA